MKKPITKFHATPDTPKTPGEAAAMVLEGQRLAEVAKELKGVDSWEKQKRSELFISKGEAALEVKEEPNRVAGGELVAATDCQLEGELDADGFNPAEYEGFLLDRTKNPDMIGIMASRERLNLADQSQCLEMALDASESIKGANSLEKMLVHQMAAAHRMAMKLMGQIGESDSDNMVKLVNASTRLMSTFQNGMQTLAKVRNGGKQEVIVQHVHVNGEAQAVVAGKMDYPTRGRGQGGGQHGK